MVPDSRQDSSLNAFLGKGSHFEGKLTFDGKVRIDGHFEGEIFSADTLVIGEGAKVNAEIEIGTAIIQGVINGNITAAESIEMRAPAEIRGNIVTPSLIVEKGVIFEGNCKMSFDSAVKKASAPTRQGMPAVTPPKEAKPALKGEEKPSNAP